jgi:Family of unknown function (DUF6263)
MSTNRPLASRRNTILLATAVLLVGLGSSSSPAAKTMLRWKFKEGDVLRYSMDQTTVSTGLDPVSGREMKQTLGLIMDMTWTIKSVDASGVATMTQKIDRVRASAAAPTGKFSFDSKEAGDAVSVAGPLFKMLVGAEFTSKMNPRGELTDVKLSDKLLATLKGENEPIGAQGQFSEEGLKNMLSQMVIPLPEAGVDVGETWQRKLAIPSGPDGQTRPIEQIFTYKGPDAAAPGLVAIDFTTKADPPKPDPNIPVTLKKESATGRFGFDNAAGRINRSNTTEFVEMSFSLQGKEIPQKVETTRVLTLSQDKTP